ncbi:MAG: hypothetical protein NTW32_02630 [Chloroflexi bacterium]|nr:hypothetical protein [Chloroflexota bacterium]
MSKHKLARRISNVMISLVLAVSLLPGYFVSAAGQTTWYVQSNGSDANCDGKLNRAAANGVSVCAFQSIRHAVDSASSGDTIKIIPISYQEVVTISSSITINKALHIAIQSGLVLRAGAALAAPMFSISGSGVRISGERTGWDAYSIINNPYNQAAHAIVVGSGVNSLIIDNLYFLGSYSTPGSAIYFAGGSPVNNLQIVNNIFAEYINIPVINFYDNPTGVVDIQGNSFAWNGQPIIKFSNLAAINQISTNLEYNNWGWDPFLMGIGATGVLEVGGQAYSDWRDRADIEAMLAPWTYANLEIAELNADTVISGRDFDFKVRIKGNNLTGVSFILSYPKDKLEYKNVSVNALFSDTTANLTNAYKNNITFTNDSSQTYLHFHALTPLTNGTRASSLNDALMSWTDLATFTFTAMGDVNADASITLDGTPYHSNFSMSPGSGPSNIIYGNLVQTPLDISVKAPYTDVTGSLSMQGRIDRSGANVTLTTGSTSVSADSIDKMTTNVTLASLPFLNDYQVTISKFGYLAITAGSDKSFDVTLTSTTLAPLELKGGDANGDNIITVNDANLIGADYAKTEASITQESKTHFTDINSSGRVDVFDLALMGGNYDTSSASAYASWSP